MVTATSTPRRRRAASGSSSRRNSDKPQQQQQEQENATLESEKAQMDQAINKTLSWQGAASSVDEMKALASTSDNKYIHAFVDDAKSMNDISKEVSEARQAVSGATKVERGTEDALDKLSQQGNKYADSLNTAFQSEKQREAFEGAMSQMESEVRQLPPDRDAGASLQEAVDKVSKWSAAGLSVDEMKTLNEKLDNPHVAEILNAPSASEALQDARVAATAMELNQQANENGSANHAALDQLAAGGNAHAYMVSEAIGEQKYNALETQATKDLDAEMSSALQEHQEAQRTAIETADFLAAKNELNEALADVQQVSLTYQFKDGTVVDQVVTYDAHETTEKAALSEAITDMSQAYQAIGQNAQDIEKIDVQSSSGTSYGFSGAEVEQFKEQLREVEQVTNYQVAQNEVADSAVGVLNVSDTASFASSDWKSELAQLSGSDHTSNTTSAWNAVQSSMESDKQFTAIPMSELLKEELSQAGMDRDSINKADAIAQAISQEKDTIGTDTFLVVHASGPALAVLTDQAGVDKQAKEGDLVIEGTLLRDMINGIDNSVKDFKDQVPTITEGMTTLDVYNQLESNTVARLEQEGVPSQLMEALAQNADKAQLNVGATPDPVITETFVAEQINNRWGEGLSDAQVLRESAADLALVQETAMNKDASSSENSTNLENDKDNSFTKSQDNERDPEKNSERQRDDEPEQSEAQAEMEMSAE